MSTNFEGITAGFCSKVIELLPREISHERMKELETSGQLRKFLKILSDENRDEFERILQATNNGAYEISSRYEIRDGVPYLGGNEIILLIPDSKFGIRGYDLFREFSQNPEYSQYTHITSSMIDFWEANPDQFPDSFKENEEVGKLEIFCWGDYLEGSISCPSSVKSVTWRQTTKKVYSSITSIDQTWNVRMPAAVLKV